MPDRLFITESEKEILRRYIERLWDGDIVALGYLQYIFHTYDRWNEAFDWLKRNKIAGHKIREYFKNATPDGHGMMEPVRQIFARIDNEKLKRLNLGDLK